MCDSYNVYTRVDFFKNVILPVFSRQNWCHDEFVLEFNNTGVCTLYESHTNCIHYMAEDARVLARITSKIKEFIQFITDSKAILQRCENEKIEAVLARECGRNPTL